MRRALALVIVVVAVAASVTLPGAVTDAAPLRGGRPEQGKRLTGDKDPRVGPRRIVVQGAGDILLHPRVQSSASAHAAPGDSSAGYAYVLAALRPVLAKGDVNVVNLETPLASARVPQSAVPPVLNAPKAAAVGLARAGFQIVSIANNHAFDQRRAGVVETRDALRVAGLVPVGGGGSAGEARAPIVVERRGVRVGILAFTEMVNETVKLEPTATASAHRGERGDVAIWRGAEDLARVRALKDVCDVLVVVIHWGQELDHAPTPFQRTTARALCAAGADLVVGSHTHTLQPVRVLAGLGGDLPSCVVAHSLGNLVSNQGLRYRLGLVPEPGRAQDDPATRDGAVLRVTFEERAPGVFRPVGIEAVPLWTENNWLQRFGDDDSFVDDLSVAPLAALRRRTARVGRRALFDERVEAIRAALGPLAPLVAE